MRASVSFVIAALLLAAVGNTALAEGSLGQRLSENDKQRLAKYAEIRAASIDVARTKGDAKDVKELNKILKGKRLSVRDFNPTGNWRCRTIKMNGILSLVVYGWFKCRIVEEDGWKLIKTSGSQRTSGRFFDDGETRMIFVGASHYSDEKPRAYGTDPDRDQVAVVTRPGKSRLRIEFPLPRYESKFDILELKR